MLIEELHLQAIGPFREHIALKPFGAGLNILAQPNEWGKSTLVKALGRAFFDRYSSSSAAIRQLQPAGTSLSPQVTVVFRARGARHRLVKRFLDGKACELSRWSGERWERTDESDRADQRLRELLGAPALDGQQPKVETWGFLRYLWARQDESADWPDWDGPSGDAARRRLATVPVDAMVRTLQAVFQARAANVLTKTGRVKSGSPLELAEMECQRVERELLETCARREALADLEQQYGRLRGELPLLDRERLEKAQEALRIRTEAEAAEKLLACISLLTTELQRADLALQQVTKDREEAAGLVEAIRITALEGERAAAAIGAMEIDFPLLEQELRRTQAGQRTQLQERHSLAEKSQRIRGLLRLRAETDAFARLRAVHERAQSSIGEIKRIEEALAQLPVINQKQLKEWQALDRGLREDRIRLEALGLQVTLMPEITARVTVKPAGTTSELAPGTNETLRAAQTLHLQLEGWGEVIIQSGAAEPAAVEAGIAAREIALNEALSLARVASVAEAEAFSLQARDLDQQLRAARAQLSAVLGKGETVEQLESALTKAAALAEQDRSLLVPTETENALSVAALHAEEETLNATLKAIAREEAESQSQIESAQRRLDLLRQKREESRGQLAAAEARTKGLEDQQSMLARRYAGGLAIALEEAQCEFARAEARLAEARRQLPPNFDQLPARNQRAARAAADVEAEFTAKSHELRRMETRLEERGGEGLFTRESDLQEALDTAKAAAARLRMEGCASRLLCELIQRHEAAAIQTVLAPLESRLSDVFAAITGVASRRVYFDESLQVRGIGTRVEDLIPFNDLSRGAREQLLLSLRAAIALELAADEPQCLILDDVLVHTDPLRHENVLDYLQQLANQMQIIVLTCHADRYRGVGRLLTPAIGEVLS